ncbi:Protein CBG25747 [Caenorhabditis briggsae]|uniref:Protein CBG25747 n=1 Tax=Caenorhabditis briggsae TaxID=6238 RepID=B6IHR8_CAEBR|nr:Protein CBG25747 [Caenorhabditis briggsae]CAR99448.1 Protein CBG25747 [Caenorhabditis briggsae]
MLFFCETIERRKIGQRKQFVTIHPKEDAISNYQNDADLLDIKAYLLENTKVQKLTLFIARFFVNSINEIRHGSDKMMPHTYRLHNEETVQSNGNRPFGRTMFTFTEVYCCEWITFVSVVGRVSRRQICCVVVGIIVLVALIVLVVYLVQEYLKYSYHQIGKK